MKRTTVFDTAVLKMVDYDIGNSKCFRVSGKPGKGRIANFRWGAGCANWREDELANLREAIDREFPRVEMEDHA